ncbi:MAG: response regulator, partial [Candidatus Competibacteraceae bacterium]|nr:response regulator [Candidatus Competibacteraceae bacterium]
MPGNKIKVLIVDDSALVRQILTEILSRDPGIEVVGSATDPYAAREKIKKLNPDVLTLDVEMPRMDGLTFLSNLMRLRPMPVVMVSSLTENGAAVTLQALELGAVDFVTKPKVDVAHALDDYALEIREKVRMAARAKVRERRSAPVESAAPSQLAAAPEKYSADVIMQRDSQKRRNFKTTDCIIAIGASTGGTEAIKEVLIRLPQQCPGVVITQHIPEAFS